jgi:hypothetical protein
MQLTMLENCLRFVNFAIAGMILQIIGALLIVYDSYKSKKSMLAINPETFEGVGDISKKIHGIYLSQFKTQIIGFSFMLSGTCCQIASELKLFS